MGNLSSRVSQDILEFSEYVGRFNHNWDGPGHDASCRLCGRKRREVIGGCMIAAAIHKDEAPEPIRATLQHVRPDHPARDLLDLPFERYMAARWQRNAVAIEMLGLGVEREWCEKTRLRWAEEYWRHRAEAMNGALSGLHDLLSEVVGSGRVSFRDEAERRRVLEAFACSLDALGREA